MGYVRKQKNFGIKQTTFALNITSMTDMFTILLVFLLQTYASSDFIVEVEKDVTLPVSSSLSNPTRSIKITLGRDELKIDGESITKLESFQFLKQDISSKDSNFIEPLFSTLEKIKKQNEKPEQDNSDTNKSVLILADSELSYETIHKVMYTASQAGYTKIKLATMLGN